MESSLMNHLRGFIIDEEGIKTAVASPVKS